MSAEHLGYRIRGDDTYVFLEEYCDGEWREVNDAPGPRPEPTVAEVVLCAKVQGLERRLAAAEELIERGEILATWAPEANRRELYAQTKAYRDAARVESGEGGS